MTSSDEVKRLREENAHLRALLERSPPDRRPVGAGISPPGESHGSCARTSPQTAGQGAADLHWEGTEHQLTKDQVVRYSRQVILPSFGAQGTSSAASSCLRHSPRKCTSPWIWNCQGEAVADLARPGVTRSQTPGNGLGMLCAAQSRLCNSSVLVVGAGGLGSPVAMYLAAAGVDRLGLADHDAVELNNLHRQIAHRESTVGIHKCDSAGLTCRSINSSIQVPTTTLLQHGHVELQSPLLIISALQACEVPVKEPNGTPKVQR